MRWIKEMGWFLTQRSAKALFKDKNPIGEKVLWNKQFELIVEAVIPDIPENSTYAVDAFVSITSLLNIPNGPLTNPNDWGINTFVELEEMLIYPYLNSKLSKDLLEQYGRNTNWGLYPYSELYFNGPEAYRHGNKQFVMLFIGIAYIYNYSSPALIILI